jgi:alpha-tubulin suppressor-like RCC1 family protein
VVLRTDGTVWTWGYNGMGQLGNGTYTDRPVPTQVPNLTNVIAIAIAAGAYHTLALKSDGTLWAWGYNGMGQLGDGTTTRRPTPFQVTAVGNTVSAIHAAPFHTVVVKLDGTAWAWGDNGNGQIGDGSTLSRASPTRVTGLTDVISVTAGQGFTAALKRDGSVWMWGSNSAGVLGDGSTVYYRTAPGR